MVSRELSHIEQHQRIILDKYLSEYPVKLGKLARELGVTIKISSLRLGISGQITNKNGKYTIRINRHEARERQRFTIAHEIAHFLLHRDVIDSSVEGITDTVLYRSGAPARIEYQANRLAADLVMPINLVKELLEKNFSGIVTEDTIESLAASFQVSKAAMEIRLSLLS